MSHHRWSGWPGAWCLDCGCADPYEQAMADNKLRLPDDLDSGRPVIWDDEREEITVIGLMVCWEPGSMRFDPYAARDGRRPNYEGMNA